MGDPPNNETILHGECVRASPPRTCEAPRDGGSAGGIRTTRHEGPTPWGAESGGGAWNSSKAQPPGSSFSQGNLQKFDTVDLPARNQAPWLTDAVGTLASGSRQGAVESRLDNPGPWYHPGAVVGLWHVTITPASCPAQLPMGR